MEQRGLGKGVEAAGLCLTLKINQMAEKNIQLSYVQADWKFIVFVQHGGTCL